MDRLDALDALRRFVENIRHFPDQFFVDALGGQAVAEHGKQIAHSPFHRRTIALRFALPKAFADIRFLLTRYEPGHDLHRAMLEAFGKVFGDKLAQHPVEMTRAVEQSGRFLSSIYEMDYRDMTRETWRRARASFDRAYGEFQEVMLPHWRDLGQAGTLPADKVVETEGADT